jgi:hypothetical protein
MRVNQIITESYFDPSIKQRMTDKGYKYLAKGEDQLVFLEPGSGMILKIFGTKNGTSPTAYTKAQQTFIVFANYCLAHPNNQFLPNFEAWEPFEIQQENPDEPTGPFAPGWLGTNDRDSDTINALMAAAREQRPSAQLYLQIRMERLFEFKNKRWCEALEEIAEEAKGGNSAEEKNHFISNKIDYSDLEWEGTGTYELLTHLGEDGLSHLWDTIYELGQIARKHGFVLDLHSGNFMLGSDGHIVISDPFFSGWSHQ